MTLDLDKMYLFIKGELHELINIPIPKYGICIVDENREVKTIIKNSIVIDNKFYYPKPLNESIN